MNDEINPRWRFGSESVAGSTHLFARDACLWVVLGLFAAVAFGPHPAQAAVIEAWVRCNSVAAGAVAVDRSGNVVVMGSSYNGTNNDYYTVKYAAADGTLLWEKRYNGPGNGNDSASSLALGPNGMVAVTGSSSGDYATVVYWENLPLVSIAPVPTGIRLRFAGVLGRSYNIERAPAVTGPWSTLATPTAPLDGLIEYVDTTAPAGSAFYRTSTP